MANYGNSNFRISDPITVDTNDLFPTHFAFLGKGGWRSVATDGDLANIPAQRLEAGSAAYVNGGSAPGLYIYNGSVWNITSLSTVAYNLPIASSSALGGVKVPNSGTIAINNSSGDISVRTATNAQTGVVQPDGSTIGISNGVISVIGSTNLPVYNNAGTLNGSYPKLQFKGDLVGLTTATIGSSTDTNVVTINPPTIVLGSGSYTKKEIEFVAGSTDLTIASDITVANRIKLTFSLSGSGTLKQHLYELADVNNGSTGWSPQDTQVLKYVVTGGVGKWTAAYHQTGIQLTNLGVDNTSPLTYNSSTGTFSITRVDTNTNGYLHQDDFDTFNAKASWPTNPAINYANYYLAPQANSPSTTTPNYVTFKDSYLNEYSKSVRLVCIASGTIAKGDIVSVLSTSNADGKPVVIKASTTNTNVIGIATEGKTNTQEIVIMIEGIVSVDTTAYINATGPVYATLTSGGYTLASSPTANSILVGYTIYNNATGFFLIDIQQLASSGTYTLSVSSPAAASINLSQNGSGTITYTGNSGAITSLTLTGGRVGQRIPLRILQQATWNAGNTFTIAANWASGTTYAAAAIVRFEDSTDNTVAYYISLLANNIGRNPKTETAYWANYITLPFGRDIALSPYNSAEDVLMLNVTNTITVGSTVYPRIIIDTLYNV